MTQLKPDQRPAASRRKFSLTPFLALGGVVLGLALFASLYLGHDIIKARVAPCEGIFEQTAIGLSTKLKVLKAEGTLEIGREAIADLSERAQMVALNLKTCCTVLDQGRLNPEEFLQCKSKARDYEAKVDEVMALVTPPAAADAPPQTAVITAAVSAAPAPGKVAAAVEAAQNVSRDFNRKIVEVRKEQALQSLDALPDANVEISAGEHEPNDDAFNANVLPLGNWAKAAIDPVKEADFFTFTTPQTYRDWIRIEVENRSTTWVPNLELFDANKASIGTTHNTTAGANIAYDFVAPPGARYTVRLNDYYGNGVGVYLVRASAQKAYDQFEPNDDILSAKPVGVGQAVNAKIMDGADRDTFMAEGGGERQITIKVANRSATLHPNVVVYDAGKSQVGDWHNTTAGGDVSFTVKVPPGPVFVSVNDYYGNSGGDYTLSLAE